MSASAGLGKPTAYEASGVEMSSLTSVNGKATTQRSSIAPSRVKVDIDVTQRELRLQRAAKEVLARYSITQQGPDRERPGQLDFDIEGTNRFGKRVHYEVTVRADWRETPSCTCIDYRENGHLHGGFCKHIIAVLLSNRELQHQLLDFLL